MKKIFIGLLLGVGLSSCEWVSKDPHPYSWNKELTVRLQENQKLTDVIWKNEELWITTRNVRPEERSETYRFTQKNDKGAITGVVFLQENITHSPIVMKPFQIDTLYKTR